MQGITVDWGSVDETFIVFKIEGKWTLSEYVKASQRAIAMLGEKPYCVNIIIDMQRAAPPPLGILNVGVQMGQKVPADAGIMVVLSKNRLWRTIINTIRHVHGVSAIEHLDLHFTSSVNEAYSLVQQVKR